MRYKCNQIYLSVASTGVHDAQCFIRVSCIYNILVFAFIVDGGWGPWSKYSECAVTCGGGNITRERRCNNPEPKYGGKHCTGDTTEAIPCNTNPCPG